MATLTPMSDPGVGQRAVVAEHETTIESRLRALEAASLERRRELDALIADVPAEVSRQALIRGVLADVRRAPKGELARRGLRKLVRMPRALVRRVLRR